MAPDPLEETTDLTERSDSVTSSHVRSRAESDARVDQTADYSPRDAVSRGLRIRCPGCHHPFDIVSDAALTDLACASCGNRFSLAGDDDESQRAEAVATIAHFELIERLGMGGFGTVWKARDTQLGRIVALKIPRRGRLTPDDIEEFLHEARVAAALSHPNIVNVYEIGRDGDNAYIVSEFMEGKSLSAWCLDHSPSHREIASLCVTIARTLHFAHDAGVIHRDLKPANILMDENGAPHVTDFGLAKRDVGDVTMTLDGRILGTPAYMPPEQALGAASTTDRRSDVYSLGAMLFQLLTGELPFRGSVQMLIHKAIHEEPPSPRSLNPTIPPDLETICLKCLEKLSDRRYQSAAEVADELARYLSGEPILARPIATMDRVVRWCRRHPAVPGLFGTLVAVTLAAYVLGWFWFSATYRQTDAALTRQSLTGVRFAADTVAQTASRQLEGRYDLVEQIVRAPEVVESLRTFLTADDLASITRELNRPELTEARRDELRDQLMKHAEHQRFQSYLERIATENQGIFGWFVLDAVGLQVARAPVNKTIGQNYAWRSYFHGEPQDYRDQAAYLRSARRRLTGTHLSAAFVSQVTDRWVVVISAPVFAPSQSSAVSNVPDGERLERSFLGVVGLMFELGHLANLPGERRGSEFAVLVDTRPGSEGVILQHPLYQQLLNTADRRLPDRFQSQRVPLDVWTKFPDDPVETHADYQDPLAADELGPAFRQRWLAAKAPVPVRNHNTGLFVIVQASYRDTIGNELERLRGKVLVLSAVTLAFVGGLVVPIWMLVLRTLR